MRIVGLWRVMEWVNQIKCAWQSNNRTCYYAIQFKNIIGKDSTIYVIFNWNGNGDLGDEGSTYGLPKTIDVWKTLMGGQYFASLIKSIKF